MFPHCSQYHSKLSTDFRWKSHSKCIACLGKKSFKQYQFHIWFTMQGFHNGGLQQEDGLCKQILALPCVRPEMAPTSSKRDPLLARAEL